MYNFKFTKLCVSTFSVTQLSTLYSQQIQQQSTWTRQNLFPRSSHCPLLCRWERGQISYSSTSHLMFSQSTNYVSEQWFISTDLPHSTHSHCQYFFDFAVQFCNILKAELHRMGKDLAVKQKDLKEKEQLAEWYTNHNNKEGRSTAHQEWDWNEACLDKGRSNQNTTGAR